MYLRAQIHVMGKKRKVVGEDGELAKEAAAPKVFNINWILKGFDKTLPDVDLDYLLVSLLKRSLLQRY